MIPLNDIQYRFWMDDCLRSDNAYNVSYSFQITGTIDERLLEMALHQVMAAYKPFHSTIRRDGMQACFLPETDFKVPLQVSQSDDSSVDSQGNASCWSRNIPAVSSLSKHHPAPTF